MKFKWYWLVFLLLVFTSSNVYAELDAWPQVEKQNIELHECEDEKLGVKFHCNPDWELENFDNTLFIIISAEKPIVTLTIAKSDVPVLVLDQLTQPALQEMGQYDDGFTVGMTTLGGLDAIKVEGNPQKFKIAQLFDHYVIHDLSLYSVMFSVNPKDNWKDYENLIYKITESFEFLPVEKKPIEEEQKESSNETS